MIWIIGLLTVLLVIDCLLLILLVLVQLPKKEAGMGQAFGGAATDALFGAGSGNALTKMTKYATVTFLVLTMGLSILNVQASKFGKTKFQRQVEATKVPAPLPMPANPAPVNVAPITTGAVSSTATPNATNLAPIRSDATNAARPATNAPPK